MTFEERVAEALAHVLSGELFFTARRSETLTDSDALALALAPRVAAAIEQAALLPDFGYPKGSLRLERGELLRRALLALRGEPESPPDSLSVKLVVRGQGTMTPPKEGA